MSGGVCSSGNKRGEERGAGGDPLISQTPRLREPNSGVSSSAFCWQMVGEDYRHPRAIKRAGEIDAIISSGMWEKKRKKTRFRNTCRLKSSEKA